MSGGSGFKIEWKDGKSPLAFRIAVILYAVILGTIFTLLVWRNIFAPTAPVPGREISRGRGSAVYYVPQWFNPVVEGGGYACAGLFVGIIMLSGYYHEQLKKDG